MHHAQECRMIAILYLGIILILIGIIWMLIAAFKTSMLWGFGCLLIAPVFLLFMVFNWDVAKKPFFLYLFGFALVFIGSSNA
jgi:hypothetical protein